MQFRILGVLSIALLLALTVTDANAGTAVIETASSSEHAAAGSSWNITKIFQILFWGIGALFLVGILSMSRSRNSGWNKVYRYLKKMGRSAAAAPVDAKTPLNARAGTGMIEFNISPFLSAQASGSLIQPPAVKICAIRAISRFKAPHLTNHVHRYYLETRGEGREPFLQVMTTPDGDIVELMYYSSLFRLNPQSMEEIYLFSDKNPNGLGTREYSLLKDQLGASGIQDLGSIFPDGADKLTYLRADGSDAPSRPAIRGTESRIDDASGEHGLMQTVHYMPYTRSIGDSKEYLLISTGIENSKDGDGSTSDYYVDFMIGVIIDKASIKVH